MKMELVSVEGWRDGIKCVPTALCAISGMPANDILMVLGLAGAPNHLGLADAYDMNHWLEAVRFLGGVPTKVTDNSPLDYAQRPTIDEFMASQRGTGLHLAVGANEQNTDTHVFAVDGNDVVDTYTGGDRIRFNGAPDDYNAFRVKYVFAISADSPPADDEKDTE
ncbi:hypothetical protein [Mesorhizobium sp. L103C131B0]|uniref:hypothetical protein n=1 Tax=Mesorhizobium sp. L103C131B0 TaxID=1287089 RepID=UPI0004CE7AE4|nr:hypothetical protein [Mesorhizobium sp. L103C131B0]